jgi:hypothetical protein
MGASFSNKYLLKGIQTPVPKVYTFLGLVIPQLILNYQTSTPSHLTSTIHSITNTHCDHYGSSSYTHRRVIREYRHQTGINGTVIVA